MGCGIGPHTELENHMTKFFLVMKTKTDGALRSAHRQTYTGPKFAYATRSGAEKFAAKIEGQVYSLQGMGVPSNLPAQLKNWTFLHHCKLARAADQMFGSK